MHQTLTAVEHQFRLRLTPAAERRGPLLGPAHVEDLLAPLDHRAVQVADRRWRHLSRRDRHHGVVEQGHALGDLPDVDEAAALTDPGERAQLGVVEAVADSGSVSETHPGARWIALEHQAEGGGIAQVPPVPHSPDRARRAVVAPGGSTRRRGPAGPCSTGRRLTRTRNGRCGRHRRSGCTRDEHVPRRRRFLRPYRPGTQRPRAARGRRARAVPRDPRPTAATTPLPRPAVRRTHVPARPHRPWAQSRPVPIYSATSPTGSILRSSGPPCRAESAGWGVQTRDDSCASQVGRSATRPSTWGFAFRQDPTTGCWREAGP
jgi:hypothetical protein